MRYLVMILISSLISMSCVACGDSSDQTATDTANNDATGIQNNDDNDATGMQNNDANSQNSGNNSQATWDEPGGQTPDNLLNTQGPVEYVITSETLAQAWQEYAVYRTVMGMPTEVVTVSEISSHYQGEDDAQKVRAFIRDAHSGGTDYFLMGGDAGQVPFRRIYMAISISMAGDYTTCGPAQVYFSNIDADFDADGDGQYGELHEDMELEDISAATVAVGRVPVDTPEEVENYFEKVRSYESGSTARTASTLLMSDVATEIGGVQIDGAEGVEKTVDAWFPQEFKDGARRLYATEGSANKYGGEVGTPENIKEALETAGYSLIFHNGHGLWNWLTNILDSGWVRSLANTVVPVMASCSCLAGNFADITDDAVCENWSGPQGPNDDSAGELFINLAHGGVAYIGNTGTGLGILGGTQFLHSFFEAVFAQGITRVGDAFSYAHRNMNSVRLNYSGLPDMSTDDSRYWTHLVVVLLGDPAIDMWTTARVVRLLASGIPESYGPGRNEWTITVTDPFSTPISGAVVTLYKEGDFLLSKQTGPDGVASFTFYPSGRGVVHVGVVKHDAIPVRKDVQPED